jgi:2-polyprenyl-3-methyl-5-hydroxy-6-metoxy-1,4-benzoquinol methylase
MPADTSTVWQQRYEASELLTVPCPFCGGGNATDIAEEFGIAIARCDACGITYTRTPRPGSQDHYRVSREDVLAKYGDILEGRRPHPRDRNYAEHLATLEALTPGRDLLDVGSHAGFFLRRARDRGWNARGVEPSEVTAAIAREVLGLDVVNATLDSDAVAPESAHVVTMVDVFEHVPNPRAVLASAHRVLRPGGLLFVKVPNVRYVRAKAELLRRLPGIRYDDLYDAREHLVYYSAETLARALTDAGFAIAQLRVPLPIDAGGPARNAVRRLGVGLARALPRGVASPLATDLAIVGRRPA